MAQSRLGKIQELKNTGARQQVKSDRKLNEMYISNYKQSNFYTGNEKDIQQDARYFYQAQHPERYAGYYDKQWQSTFDALQSLRTNDAQSYDSGWQSSYEKMQERLNKLRDQSKKWASNVERFFDDPSSVRKWSQSVDQNYSNATSFLTGYRDFWGSFSNADDADDNDDAREGRWYDWKMTSTYAPRYNNRGNLVGGIDSKTSLDKAIDRLEKAGDARGAQWLREHDADYMTEAELKTALEGVRGNWLGDDEQQARAVSGFVKGVGLAIGSWWDERVNGGSPGVLTTALSHTDNIKPGGNGSNPTELAARYQAALDKKRENNLAADPKLLEAARVYKQHKDNDGKATGIYRDSAGNIVPNGKSSVVNPTGSTIFGLHSWDKDSDFKEAEQYMIEHGYDPETYATAYGNMLAKERLQKVAGIVQGNAQAGILGNVADAALYATTFATKPLEAFTGVEAIKQAVTGEINPYDEAFLVANVNNAIRNTVINEAAKNTDKTVNFLGHKEENLASFIINTATSAIDSGVSMAISYGLGSWLGMPAGSQQMNSFATKATQLLMSGEVFTDELVNAKKNGWSDARALTWSVTKGAIEAATEKYSIEAILNPGSSLLRQAVKSFVAEGMEEVASDVLGTAEDILWNGSHAEIMENYYRNVNSGMQAKDAASKTLAEYLADNAESFIAGGLSGLAMGGVGTGATLTRDYKTGSNIRQSDTQQIIVGAASKLDLSENADLAKRVEQANKKLTADKNAGKILLGQIARLGTEQAAKEQAQAYADAMAAQLEEQGYAPQTARAVAEAYVKLQTGKELTRGESRMMRSIGDEQIAAQKSRAHAGELAEMLTESDRAFRSAVVEQLGGSLENKTPQNIADAVEAAAKGYDGGVTQKTRHVVQNSLIADSRARMTTDERVEGADALLRLGGTTEAAKQALARQEAARKAGETLSEHLWEGRAAEKAKREDRAKQKLEDRRAVESIASAVNETGVNDKSVRVLSAGKGRITLELPDGTRVSTTSESLGEQKTTLNPDERAILSTAAQLRSAEDANAMIYYAQYADEPVAFASQYLSVYNRAARGDAKAGVRAENAGLSQRAFEAAYTSGQTKSQDVIRVGGLEMRGRAGIGNYSPRTGKRGGVTDLTSAQGKQEYVERGGSRLQIDMTMDVLRDRGKKYGIDYVLVDSIYENTDKDNKAHANGHYDGDHTVYIAMDGESPLLTAASHETYHYFKQKNRASAMKLQGYIIDALQDDSVMGAEAYAKLYDSVADAYKDLTAKLSEREREDYIREEIAANSVFDVFSNEKTIRALHDSDPGLFGALKARITDFISDLKRHMERRFGGDSGSHTAAVARALSENVERMETIRRMFDEIGEEVAKQVREPGRRAFADALRGQLDQRVQATAADEAAKWDKDHSYVPFSEVKAVEGKFSRRSDVLALQGVDWMDNYSTIKDQLAKHRDEINQISPVATVEYGGEEKLELERMILDQVKLIGGERMNRNRISFAFDAKGIHDIVSHARAEELRAASLAAPYVAKYGILIAGQKNHKGNSVASLTFAAPVIIDNQPIHVGVAVQFTNDGRAHAVNVAYVNEGKNKKPARGLRSRTTHSVVSGLLTNAGSGDRIAQPTESVKSRSSLIATDQDADYLAAVERGDMETAQRMVDEAARAAGYTIRAQHGSFAKERFTVFEPGYRGEMWFGSPGTAYNRPQMYDVYLKMDNPYEVTYTVGLGSKFDPQDVVENGRHNKHDGAIVNFRLDAEMANQAIPGFEKMFPDMLATDEFMQSFRFMPQGDLLNALAKPGETVVEFMNRGAKEDLYQWYVVYKPSQIKSADPVTYFKNGEVVPLSERFNEKQTDIRFSRAGADSKTADKSMLRLAEDMEKQARSSEEIRQATGWYRSYDRNWSYEIDDSKMDVSFSGLYAEDGLFRMLARLDKKLINGEITQEEWEAEYKDLGGDRAVFKPRYIGDIVRHDELFDAYPFLKNLSISFEDLGPKTLGEWRPWERTIALSKSIRGDLSSIKSVLIHEMQHAVQFYEGFSKGASPEYWDMQLRDGFDGRTEAQKQELEEAEKEYRAIYREDEQFVLDMTYLLDEMHPDVPRGEFDFDTWTQIEEDPQEWKDFDAERDRLAEKYGTDKVYHFMNLYYHLKERRGQTGRNADQLYWNTAGEIEARDAQARLDMTAEERRAKRPDIDRKDVVFRWSLQVQYADGTNRTIPKVSEMTDADILGILEQTKAGKVRGHSYIPVKQNTSAAVVRSLRAFGVDVEDRPLVMEANKANAAMSSKKPLSGFTPHKLSPKELISVLKGLDDPSAIVFQTERHGKNGEPKNDNVAVFVTINGGLLNGRDGFAVIEFDPVIASGVILDEQETAFNTVVTAFVPDNDRNEYYDYYEALLEKDANFDVKVIEQATDETSHPGDSPMTNQQSPATATVPHPDEEVKPSEKSSRITTDSAFAYTATAKENEELRRTVASLSRALEKTRLQLNAAKRETVQTRSGGITDRFDARARNQLYTLAGRYIREADSTMEQKELADRLAMVLQSVFNTEYGHLGDDTMNALADIGYDMLRQKKRHRTTDARSEFRREARSVTYYINPEEQKNLADHYGSWKKFRETAQAHGITYTTNKAYARNGRAAMSIGELLQASESNGDGYDLEKHSILFDWSGETFDVDMSGAVPDAVDFFEALFGYMDGTARGLSGMTEEDVYDTEYDWWAGEQKKALAKAVEEGDQYRVEEIEAELYGGVRAAEATDFAVRVLSDALEYVDLPTFADVKASELKAAQSALGAEQKAHAKTRQAMEKEAARLNSELKSAREAMRRTTAKMAEAAQQAKTEQEQAVAEARKTGRLQERQRIENRDSKRALRKSIRDNVSRLDKLLRGPKDAAFIPDELRGVVRAFVDVFLNDTSVFDRKTLATIAADYARLNTESEEGVVYDAQVATWLDELRDELPELAETFDEVEPTERNKYSKLTRMDLEQLRKVSDIAEHFAWVVSQANKMFFNGRSELRQAVCRPDMDRFRRKGIKTRTRLGATDTADKLRSGVKSYMVKEMIPIYFFERLGGNAAQLWYDIEDGQAEWGLAARRAADWWDELASRHKGSADWWKDKKENRLNVTLDSGENITLTRDEVMALYATFKREQTSGFKTNHVLGGGIRITHKIDTVQNGRRGAVRNAEPYSLTQGDLTTILDFLTDEQKAFADEAVGYLSGELAAGANETSRMLCGYSKFTESYYFPFKTDPALRGRSVDEEQNRAQNALIKNKGFTVSTTANANSPLLLGSFTDIWESHVSDILMYTHMAVPQTALAQWYNYKVRDVNAQTGEKENAKTMRAALDNAYGKEYTDYIDTLLRDMSGSVTSDGAVDLLEKGLSSFKKMAVFANMSVVIQQPSAFLRALTEVDAKYFATLPKTVRTRSQWAEMMKYSGVAVLKDVGGFDMNNGRGLNGYITNKDGLREKFDNAMGAGAEIADKVTWVYMWQAIKKETAAKTGLKGEELLRAAGKRFDYVMAKTQVYDSKINKSAYMRSQNTLAKIATSFMAEPTKSFNTLTQGIYRLHDAETKADKAAGMKLLARSAAAFVAASVLNELLQSIVGALRDKDEDRTLWEKYLANFSENLLTDLFIPSMLPYFRDVTSIMQGYDATRSDLSPVTAFYDAIEQTVKAASGSGDWQKALVSDVNILGILTGIPAKNLSRLYTSFMNLTKATAYNVPEGQAGLRIRATLNEALDSFLPTFLRDYIGHSFENYGSVVDAILAGNDAEAEQQKDAIRAYLAIRGKPDADEQNKRINTRLKAEVKDRVLAGAIDDKDAIRILEEELGVKKGYEQLLTWKNGSDSKWASLVPYASSFMSGDYKAYMEGVQTLVSEGMASDQAVRKISDIVELVKSAAQARVDGDEAAYDDIVSELTESYLYSPSQLEKDIATFSGLTKSEPKEAGETEDGYSTGYTYSQLADAVISGNTELASLVREDMRKAGRTDKQIDQQVTSKMKSAYEDGRIDKEQARSYLKERGLTDGEIELKLREWDGVTGDYDVIKDVVAPYMQNGGSLADVQAEIKFLTGSAGKSQAGIISELAKVYKPQYVNAISRGDTSTAATIKSRFIAIAELLGYTYEYENKYINKNWK